MQDTQPRVAVRQHVRHVQLMVSRDVCTMMLAAITITTARNTDTCRGMGGSLRGQGSKSVVHCCSGASPPAARVLPYALASLPAGTRLRPAGCGVSLRRPTAKQRLT